MMTKRWDWKDYHTTEYGKIDPMKTIAILPTVAIEQHGPHLPVGPTRSSSKACRRC